MKITSVKIHKVEKEGSRLKGYANVTIDDAIAIHDIRIIQGDRGPFIAMPSRPTPTGDHKDYVHPINQEVRTMFEKEILDAYDKADDVQTSENE